MSTYKTLMLIKPDAVGKKVIGQILSMVETRFYISDLFFIKFNKSTAEDFYIEHFYKPFYKELVDFIISGRVLVLIIEGDSAIVGDVRDLVGHTDYSKATSDSIRGKFASDLTNNAVHASDSIESYIREINIIFKNLM